MTVEDGEMAIEQRFVAAGYRIVRRVGYPSLAALTPATGVPWGTEWRAEKGAGERTAYCVFSVDYETLAGVDTAGLAAYIVESAGRHLAELIEAEEVPA